MVLAQKIVSPQYAPLKALRKQEIALSPEVLSQVNHVERERYSYVEQVLNFDVIFRLFESVPLEITLHQKPGPLPTISSHVIKALGLILREGLTNVIQHAGAERCDVHLSVEGDLLILQIEDDGCGISPQNSEGIGLYSMRKRTVELGGWLILCDNPNPHNTRKGTRISIHIPLSS